MKEEIRKVAEEGGYEFPFHTPDAYEDSSVYESDRVISELQAMLDPKFWQALERRLRWRPIEFEILPSIQVMSSVSENSGPISAPIRAISKTRMVRGWVYFYHKFTDNIIEGKNTNDFFRELLTNHIEKL